MKLAWKITITLLLLAAAGIFIGCQVGASGTLQLELTDAPLVIDGETVTEVNVTITKVMVSYGTHEGELADVTDPGEYYDPTLAQNQISSEEANWMILSEETKEFNLLDLQNGVTEILEQASLPAGRYNQIRLILSETNTIVFDGDPAEYDLKVPSASETGVKLVGGFEIPEGGITRIVLDFDVQQSVEITIGAENPYILHPTVKIVTVEAQDG